MDYAKVGLYLRLSRDDDKKEESESISNQRIFLQQYAAQMDFTVVETYIDDGYSGTHFNRPGFLRMLADIELGKINTVITKDLSRLGREYIQTGYYLEHYFPEKRVRYIAVNENIDTIREEGAGMYAPFVSVFNDMYAQDISKKVRAALLAKKKAGKFIGSSPPFGYEKSPHKAGQLMIDEAAATVVRGIFDYYLQVGSLSSTAKMLTQRHIPTPSAYRGLTHTQKRFQGVWSSQMVRRILTNPTYIGNLTQNRSKTISCKVKKKIDLPPAQWITVTNTHEAIISKADFARVQQLIQKRSYIGRGGHPAHLLTGLAFCADCGAPMTYVKESPTRTYMVCQSYRKESKLCTSHCIRESYVHQVIQASLRQLCEPFINIPALTKLVVAENQAAAFTGQYQIVTNKLAFARKAMLSLYKDKVSGAIHGEEYQALHEDLSKECKQLEFQCKEFQTLLQQSLEQRTIEDRIKNIFCFDPLSRASLLMLLHKVCIYQDKKIEIFFRFPNPQ